MPRLDRRPEPVECDCVVQPVQVTLELVLDEQGKVEEARAPGVSGKLAEAALAAARKLVFRPAMWRGKPVACRIRYVLFVVPPRRDVPRGPSAARAAAGTNVESPGSKERQQKPPVGGKRRSRAPGRESRQARAAGGRGAGRSTVRAVRPLVEYGTVVQAERPLTASSDRVVRARDFLLLPRRTASDMLLMVPALHISQHSGSGKGHQLFLRGFDAEHGQTVALFFEGVPLNASSHVHGIGYTDLHFLIPAAMKAMEVLKGPYDVRFGDYAIAGSINFVMADELPHPYVQVGGGSFRTLNASVLFSPHIPGLKALVALEGFRTDGFVENGYWRGLRGLAKVGRQWGRHKLWAVAAGYASTWQAPDAVPERLVETGAVDFYGGLDDSDGGAAGRGQISLHYRWKGPKSSFQTLAYLVRQETSVFTNYTYFLQFPEHGDQTEQDDARWTTGASAEWSRDLQLGPVGLRLLAGGQWRYDLVAANLYRTERRRRWDVGQEMLYDIHDLGMYSSVEVLPVRWARAVVGLRYDYFSFRVDGVQDFVRPSGALEEDRPVTGVAGRGVFQPKATLVLSPHRLVDVFLNYGIGFHSPDARDPVLNPDEEIPVAHAGELGVRFRWRPYLDVAAAVWSCYQESDVFFDPTEGRSVDQGQSIRVGGELEVRSSLGPVYLYADLSYTYARLLDQGQPPIGSPSWLFQGGGVFRWHIRKGPGLTRGSLLKAGLRIRYVGERYLAEAATGEAATLLDALVAWDTRWFGLELSATNMLNARWKDAQFYYTSRASLDEPLGGVKDRHFTAGSPLSVQAALRVYVP